MTSENTNHDDDMDHGETEMSDAESEVMAQIGRELDASDDLPPMLQEPRRIHGEKDPCYSPSQFYAMTHTEENAVDGSDERFWLVEEEVDRVHKKGIRLGGEWYWHPDLDYFITGQGHAPQADLVIRFNKALLARGTLDKVRVLRRDEAGRYHTICTCGLREKELEQWDFAELLERREKKLKRLAAKRSLSEQEIVSLRAGTEHLEKLREAELARERSRNFGRRSGSRPASPERHQTRDTERDQDEDGGGGYQMRLQEQYDEPDASDE